MSLIIRPATEADDAGILKLISNTPQPGRIMLNFERMPSFFLGANVTCERPDIWLAEESGSEGDILAVFNIGSRRMYFNGEARNIRYAHDLRIDPAKRGSTLLVRLFRRLREMLEDNEWMQTVILSDNDTSLNTIGSGRAGLPTYYPCGDIESSMLFAPPLFLSNRGLTVRPAEEKDLPAMQAFMDELAPQRQFYPVYQLQDLLTGSGYYRGLKISDYWLAWRGNELQGMAGIWDQKSFKQTRAISYTKEMAFIRHAYNLYGAIFGGVRLPPAGGLVNYRPLHSVLIRNNDPHVLAVLLRPLTKIMQNQRAALVCGFFENDPLREAVRRFRRQTMASRHFLVSYGDNPVPTLDPERIPYIEVARL